MSQKNEVPATQNPFGAPEAGDLSKERKNFPVVEYATMKTPGTMAKHITKAMIDDALANNKLGFSFWDKEQGQRIHVGDGFTFVVLEVYSQISGKNEIGTGVFETFYSNKIRDSRTEPFAIFRQGEKSPILKGLYNDLKGDKVKNIPSKLPKGCSFHLVFVIYWLEGSRILNLKVSVMVSAQLKEAIAMAERAVGRGTKSSDVNLFGLAENSLWGFKFNTYRRVDKDGADYKSGDLYFVPVFYAGVVKNEGPNANPDLYNLCREYQTEVRLQYQAQVERRKQYGDEVVTEEVHENPPVDQHVDDRFPSIDQEPATAPGDDLPF